MNVVAITLLLFVLLLVCLQMQYLLGANGLSSWMETVYPTADDALQVKGL
jgi:hypothetical protein